MIEERCDLMQTGVISCWTQFRTHPPGSPNLRSASSQVHIRGATIVESEGVGQAAASLEARLCVEMGIASSEMVVHACRNARVLKSQIYST